MAYSPREFSRKYAFLFIGCLVVLLYVSGVAVWEEYLITKGLKTTKGTKIKCYRVPRNDNVRGILFTYSARSPNGSIKQYEGKTQINGRDCLLGTTVEVYYVPSDPSIYRTDRGRLSPFIFLLPLFFSFAVPLESFMANKRKEADNFDIVALLVGIAGFISTTIMFIGWLIIQLFL